MTRQPPEPATAPRHPLFARWYARLSQAMEQGVGDYRDELLAGLAGRILEIGAGNGLNFAHYPPTVTEVVAVEPEPYLRGLAQAAAVDEPVPIRVVDGHAEALPVGEGSVDAAIASLVLCSVPDQARALAELARVIRPGSDLRFFEHVRAEGATLAGTQRALDLVWPILGGGCHVSRDTLAAITAAGFQVTNLRRFRFPDTRIASPTSPHILGIARRPATPEKTP
jgi:SAM-dependent methyltransferase